MSETTTADATRPELAAMERRIVEIMVEELKLEGASPDTFDATIDLVDEIGLDSMDLTTVLLLLQDEYGVTVLEKDYPTLRTVRAVAEYLRARL